MVVTHLFIDGSFDPIAKVGIGAYLKISDDQINAINKIPEVHFKYFYKTTSNKLELQTCNWAMSVNKKQDHKLIIYTDSQTIIDLPFRKNRLTKSDYRNKHHHPLNNKMEYLTFYKITSSIEHSIIKVKGHLSSKKKGVIDILFSKVDKAARKELRNYMSRRDMSV